MTISASSIFGSNVTLDETDPTDRILQIHLNDFRDIANGGDIANGVGINDPNTITVANLDSNASKLLASIIKLHFQKQPVDNDDETNGTYIEHNPNFDISLPPRNNILQRQYRYTVNIYTPDSGSEYDVDDVVG